MTRSITRASRPSLGGFASFRMVMRNKTSNWFFSHSGHTYSRAASIQGQLDIISIRRFFDRDVIFVGHHGLQATFRSPLIDRGELDIV